MTFQRMKDPLVSVVQYELVCFSGGHLADPVMSQLKEWCL